MSERPPKPRLALAIGIVGHRLNRLSADKSKLQKISNSVEDVLDRVAHEAVAARAKYSSFFSSETPVVSVVTALAEGADRLAAKATIARVSAPRTLKQVDVEFALDVPLPFPATAY